MRTESAPTTPTAADHERTGRRSPPNAPPTLAIIGAGLVALGVLLLLGQLDVIDAGAVARRGWPVIILAVGLYWLWRGPRIGGIVVTIVGALWLADVNDLLFADAGRLTWPIVLIIVGGTIVVAAIRGRSFGSGRTPVALFDTRRWSGPIAEYAGANLTTVFGDANLQLKSDAVSDDASLGVTTIFGDVDVSVPAGWRIHDGVTSVFGSVRVPQTQPDWPEAPMLTVHGLALFGDVDLRYDD